MRSARLLVLVAFLPTPASAQLDATPSRLAEVELERSRACVSTLREVRVVDESLQPLVTRGQRLQLIAQAVAIEDRAMVEPFDTGDATETLVRDWFVTDAALAQRYLTTENASLLTERTAGRETIKAVVSEALADVQNGINGILQENQELLSRAGPCDGAIFVRPAVLEACASEEGPICDQAALPAGEATDYRFVDAAESVWEISDIRPWTVPTPLQPTPQGQLDGARTIGYARVGNVVVSASFSPLFRDRQEVPAEELAAFRATNDSLGLSFDHPELAVAPGLGLRAALPVPLGTETRYVIHFGSPDAPDVLWSGPAGTGAPLEAAVPIGATHVQRLRAGEPLTLTAFGGAAGDEAEYSIQLSAVNQGPATTVLLNYMEGELARDLARLIQPRG